MVWSQQPRCGKTEEAMNPIKSISPFSNCKFRKALQISPTERSIKEQNNINTVKCPANLAVEKLQLHILQASPRKLHCHPSKKRRCIFGNRSLLWSCIYSNSTVMRSLHVSIRSALRRKLTLSSNILLLQDMLPFSFFVPKAAHALLSDEIKFSSSMRGGQSSIFDPW